VGRTAFKQEHFPSNNQAHEANDDSSILEKIYQDAMNAIAWQFGLLNHLIMPLNNPPKAK
jgi:hypothetical protein